MSSIASPVSKHHTEWKQRQEDFPKLILSPEPVGSLDPGPRDVDASFLLSSELSHHFCLCETKFTQSTTWVKDWLRTEMCVCWTVYYMYVWVSFSFVSSECVLITQNIEQRCCSCPLAKRRKKVTVQKEAGGSNTLSDVFTLGGFPNYLLSKWLLSDRETLVQYSSGSCFPKLSEKGYQDALCSASDTADLMMDTTCQLLHLC